jgi:heme-degrading monooxygenase HmoA
MFTRIVECHVKPEKKDEFNQKLRNDVLPILNRQPGFVDLISLVQDTDRERQLALSFWNTKEDAERYHRENYNRIVEMIKPYLKKDPKVETFNVDTSTSHRIAAGKAA